MRFGLVPARAQRARPWAIPMDIGAPPGLEEQVSPVQALVDDKTSIGRGFRMYCYPTPPEIEALRKGAPLELTIYGQQLQPVSLEVLEEQDQDGDDEHTG